MAALLEFMYKGEVHVSQDALSSFLKAAECLQVKGLSIEHEKLAVAQSHTQRAQDMEVAPPPLDSPTRKRFKVRRQWRRCIFLSRPAFFFRVCRNFSMR